MPTIEAPAVNYTGVIKVDVRTYAYSTQDGNSWALHTDHVSLCTSSLIYNNAKHTPLTTLVTSYNCHNISWCIKYPNVTQ